MRGFGQIDVRSVFGEILLELLSESLIESLIDSRTAGNRSAVVQ